MVFCAAESRGLCQGISKCRVWSPALFTRRLGTLIHDSLLWPRACIDLSHFLGFGADWRRGRFRLLPISFGDEVLEERAEVGGGELDAGAAACRSVDLGSFADQRAADVAQRQQNERRQVGAQTGDVTVTAVDRKPLRQRVDGHADPLPCQDDGCHRAEYVQVFDDRFQRVPETVNPLVAHDMRYVS